MSDIFLIKRNPAPIFTEESNKRKNRKHTDYTDSLEFTNQMPRRVQTYQTVTSDDSGQKRDEQYQAMINSQSNYIVDLMEDENRPFFKDQEFLDAYEKTFGASGNF